MYVAKSDTDIPNTKYYVGMWDHRFIIAMTVTDSGFTLCIITSFEFVILYLHAAMVQTFHCAECVWEKKSRIGTVKRALST